MENVVDKKNKDKSLLMIFICWLVYTTAYLGRYSFNSNITLIIESFNTSKAEAGIIGTCFFFAYGVGQVVNGLLCKKYNKRFALSVALIVSSILNLAVFLGVPFVLYKYLWLINGAVQSILWPSLVCVVAESISKKYINKSIIVMSTTTPLGTLVVYGLSSVLALSGSFKWSFLVASIMMVIVAIVWATCYVKPQKQVENLENVATENQGENVDQTKALQGKGENKNKDKAKSKLPTAVIILAGIMAFCAVANNLIKDGLQTWVPDILKSNFNLSDSLSIILTVFLPLVGIFGAIFSTFLYKYIKDFVFISGLLFFGSVGCILGVLFLLNGSLWILVLCLFAITVMLMHGINNVITNMFPLYLCKSNDAGKISGILNGFCYLGSTISSYGLGFISDMGGWNSVFIFLLGVCIIPVFMTIIYSLIKLKKAKKDKINFN